MTEWDRDFYLIGTPSDDSQVLGRIRNIHRRQIVLFILEHEVCTFGEILVHINKAPSTLSWHLKRLSDAGIISVIHKQKCQLYRIVNSKLVSYVLSKYGQSLRQNCWSMLSSRGEWQRNINGCKNQGNEGFNAVRYSRSLLRITSQFLKRQRPRIRPFSFRIQNI